MTLKKWTAYFVILLPFALSVAAQGVWKTIPETTRLERIMELRLGASGDDLWILMQMEKLERVHRIASTLDEDAQAIV